jgi:hypothetical protein
MNGGRLRELRDVFPLSLRERVRVRANVFRHWRVKLEDL